MLNIFNLFLFLLALWIMFAISAGNVSWVYVFFGIGASLLVSIFSYKLQIIEKKSELLYLSLGFYRHFLKIFFNNFSESIKIVLKMALSKNDLNPLVYEVKIDEKISFNPALLMISLNMTAGLFCIGLKDNNPEGQKILVHAISRANFKKFDFKKICKSLNNVNDDNLV
jgi:multisubunit Na+/H+ antiporter MnhE subunit